VDRTTRLAFLLLILAQAAHSVEEYAFRLYDQFPPARFIADSFGFDRPVGFVLFNILIILFGLWCWFARLRPQHRSARGYAWFWTLLELGNGLGHIGLALLAGGYFPGLFTAPLLLATGGWLAFRLIRTKEDAGS